MAEDDAARTKGPAEVVPPGDPARETGPELVPSSLAVEPAVFPFAKRGKKEKDKKEQEPASGPDEQDKASAKQRKRELKLKRDAHRSLDSWERYRALTDVLDEAMELIDLADHKARFALVIMAALNVVLFFVGTRSELLEEIPARLHVWLGVYVLLYALVALYFFLQAIESLRPRKSQPQVRYVGETGFEEHPLGLRFYEDILSRDLEAYRRAWREVHIGQLNNELAVQAHALAEINRAKYTALRRLYMGLKIMTLMAVGLVGIGALLALIGTTRGGKQARRAAVLGEPERLTVAGIAEPSGIAYHAALGHLFVAGDEGSLAELDSEGRLLRSFPVKGNLEDIAVYAPTGELMLLNERKSELLLYDPVRQAERRTWKLDRAGLLGQQPGDKNNGFEGLAFREAAGVAGGGVWYLVHQRAPAMLIEIAFDPAQERATLGGDVVQNRWPLSLDDLTAVTWVPSLERLLIVAEKKDRILVLRAAGGFDKEVPLPGRQQEGLAFDASGRLWVADDADKSLLRFEGALSVLDEYLRDRGVSPSADPLQPLLGGTRRAR